MGWVSHRTQWGPPWKGPIQSSGGQISSPWTVGSPVPRRRPLALSQTGPFYNFGALAPSSPSLRHCKHAVCYTRSVCHVGVNQPSLHGKHKVLNYSIKNVRTTTGLITFSRPISPLYTGSTAQFYQSFLQSAALQLKHDEELLITFTFTNTRL